MSALLHSLADTTARSVSNAPEWLDQARAENLRQAIDMGLPGASNEAWKYTSLRALGQRAFAAVDTDAGAHGIDAALLDLPGVAGPRLVFVNGAFRADLSQLTDLPHGLQLQPLSDVLQHDAESLRPFLRRDFAAAAEQPARLNAAIAVEGVVLRVSAGAQITTPLQVVFCGAPARQDIAWFLRCIVLLGAGARLSLVERHMASGAHAHLGNVLVDYRLDAGATLDLVRLQLEGAQASLLQRSDMSLAAQSRINVHDLDLGAALARHELRIALDGEQAFASVRGVFALGQRQHNDTQLSVDHRARDTGCDLFWRGVADGRARGVFNGAITIHAGADGADARLSNKNLLLSAQAEIDTKPVLEIYADEVKASHGATVGQLDDTALFYLRSRGLPLGEARMLLIQAFCASALAQIEPAALRGHVTGLLRGRLPDTTLEARA